MAKVIVLSLTLVETPLALALRFAGKAGCGIGGPGGPAVPRVWWLHAPIGRAGDERKAGVA